MRIRDRHDLANIGGKTVREQIERELADRPIDNVPRGTRFPEEAAGRELIAWADTYLIPAPWDSRSRIPIGELLAHNANGGLRIRTEAAILVGQGVRKGWPDYTLYLARGSYHGAVLELKAPDGKNPMPEQLEILRRLERAGFRAFVAWGSADAIAALTKYEALR